MRQAFTGSSIGAPGAAAQRQILVLSLHRNDARRLSVSLSIGGNPPTAKEPLICPESELAELAKVDVRKLSYDEAKKIGARLSQAVLVGCVGTKISSLLAPDIGVPLFVECEADDLFGLPWELLLHPKGKGEFFVLTIGGSLTRLLRRGSNNGPTQQKELSRLALFVYGSAQGDALNFTEIRRLSSTFCQTNGFVLAEAIDATRSDFVANCNGRNPDIVFYSGHGHTTGTGDLVTTTLRLSGPDRVEDEVPWSVLHRPFGVPPAIVVLNACETAGAGGELRLAPAAKEAMDSGTGLFIGHRNIARTDMAAVLATEVLAAVLWSEPFDEMLARVRHRAHQMEPLQTHWANFVAYAEAPEIPEHLLPLPIDAPGFFTSFGIKRDINAQIEVTHLTLSVAGPVIGVLLAAGLLMSYYTWRAKPEPGDVYVTLSLLVPAALLFGLAMLGRHRVVDFLDKRIEGLGIVIRFLKSIPLSSALVDRQRERRYGAIGLGADMLCLEPWAAVWLWQWRRGVMASLVRLIKKLIEMGAR